jgi:hypothetical protein
LHAGVYMQYTTNIFHTEEFSPISIVDGDIISIYMYNTMYYKERIYHTRDLYQFCCPLPLNAIIKMQIFKRTAQETLAKW